MCISFAPPFFWQKQPPLSLDEAFFAAIELEECYKVKKLLAFGASLSFVSHKGWLPLARAAHSGDVRIVRLLLEHGASVTESTTYGWTALHHAAYAGNQKVVALLRNAYADDTATTSRDYTPLCLARISGNKGLYRALKGTNLRVYEYSRELRYRKVLGHMLGLSGVTALLNPNPTKQHIITSYEGWNFWEFWHIIAKRGSLFFKNNPIVLQAIGLANNASLKTLLKAYQGGKVPVIIKTGFNNHYVSAILWGPFFILCNRGPHSGSTSCEVLPLNPARVTLSLIRELQELPQKSADYYRDYINAAFPSRHKQDNTPLAYLALCISIAWQLVGNCSWANAEAAIYVLLVLEACSAQGFLQNLSREEISQICNQQKEVFERWQHFMLETVLTKYLKRKTLTIASHLYPRDQNILNACLKLGSIT